MKTALLKTIASLAVLMGIACLLAACSSKEDSMREMETLSADMNLHSAGYTEGQWEEALDKYRRLSEKLDAEDLSSDELQRIGKAKGIIAGCIAKQAAKEAGATLRDALDEASGFIDGFLNGAVSGEND